MQKIRNPFTDPQCAPAVAHCSYCGGALYDTDTFYAVNGRLVCQACLPDFAAEEFASFQVTGREWRQL